MKKVIVIDACCVVIDESGKVTQNVLLRKIVQAA